MFVNHDLQTFRARALSADPDPCGMTQRNMLGFHHRKPSGHFKWQLSKSISNSCMTLGLLFSWWLSDGNSPSYNRSPPMLIPVSCFPQEGEPGMVWWNQGCCDIPMLFLLGRCWFEVVRKLFYQHCHTRLPVSARNGLVYNL